MLLGQNTRTVRYQLHFLLPCCQKYVLVFHKNNSRGKWLEQTN